MTPIRSSLIKPIEAYQPPKGVHPMMPSNQNAVSIKTKAGNMGFGKVEWVVRDSLQIQADMDTAVGTDCEIRMELMGLPRSIHLQAQVTEVWPAEDTASHIRLQLSKEQTEDRQRLDRWLNDQARGGTSGDPASWTQDPSSVHSKRGRKTITDAFRDRRGATRALRMPMIDIPLEDLAAELKSK